MVICYPHFYPQGPAVLTSGPVSPEDLARLSGQPAPWRRFQCRGWRVLQGSSRFNPPEAGKKQSFVLFLGRIMMRNGWIWACLCFQTSPCHHISAVTVRIRSTIQWKLLCFDLLQILMFLYVSSTFCREFLFGRSNHNLFAQSLLISTATSLLITHRGISSSALRQDMTGFLEEPGPQLDDSWRIPGTSEHHVRGLQKAKKQFI